MRQILVCIAVAFLIVGCDDGGGSGFGAPGEPCYADGTCNAGLTCISNLCGYAPSCNPGDQQACTCTGGGSGTQICESNQAWGACDCGSDCGNNVCDVGESNANCPEDCGSDCGNNVCDVGESNANCPEDCPAGSCGGQECAATETCYDTVCHTGVPDCLDPTHPEYMGWPTDLDLEPNGTPETAVVLPCGDDGVFTDPAEYAIRCPSRTNYTNGYMNLVICPASEQDMYALFLLSNESVDFRILYQYNATLPRDLDARIIRYDNAVSNYVDVTVGMSTNDNEELNVSTLTGSGNPQGWYYVVVFGKTGQDLNYYTVSFTLNP